MRFSTRAVGIGVIGLGIMGSAYVEVLSELPQAKLVGLSDLKSDLLQATCNRFGIEGYLDFRGLLARDDIEAVAICTPEAFHLEPARLAAQKGLDMLIEKPLALDSATAEEIIALSASGSFKLMVGHILRFDPRYFLAYESIQRGDIGDIIHIYTRRSGLASEGRYFGGRVTLALCFGVHDFDIIRWFTGSEVHRVHAEGARKVLADLAVDDSVMCVLKLTNGTVCSCELCWALPDGANPASQDVMLELVGTQGVIKIEGQRQGLELDTLRGAVYPDTLFSPRVGGSLFGALKHELAHFLDCVRNDRQPLVDPHDAVKAIRIAEAVDRSLVEAQPITLDV